MRANRKIRISEFDMRVVINGLHQMQKKYDYEKQYKTVCVLSRVLDYHKSMKPNTSQKINFKTEDIGMIIRCLLDWRNTFLSAGKSIEADAVGDVLRLFVK